MASTPLQPHLVGRKVEGQRVKGPADGPAADVLVDGGDAAGVGELDPPAKPLVGPTAATTVSRWPRTQDGTYWRAGGGHAAGLLREPGTLAWNVGSVMPDGGAMAGGSVADDGQDSS